MITFIIKRNEMKLITRNSLSPLSQFEIEMTLESNNSELFSVQFVKNGDSVLVWLVVARLRKENLISNWILGDVSYNCLVLLCRYFPQ